MHEVGSWFIYLMDAAIIAIFGMVALILIFIKRGQYQKEANRCIRAEIWQPTGWSEYHTVPCDFNAKSVSVSDFLYTLNPGMRRYGKHPMNPFMGIPWLQVPIRVESWFQDNTEPIRQTYTNPIATAAEIKAMTREVGAATAAMQIQEVEARQKELTKAIANQPNKMIIYCGIGGCALLNLIILIIVVQLGGIV